MSVLKLVQDKLGKQYFDLQFLLECLNETLIENGEESIASAIPWITTNHEIDLETFNNRHIQLYSMVFQLLNIVEVNGAVQNRRKQEDLNSMASVNGLWAKNLQDLVKDGYTDKEIATTMPEVKVEPVLTAHPTEAKRATVLEHHRNIYLMMVKR